VSYWTTLLAIVAGLCLAFGLLELFYGWYRTSRRTLHIQFATFAILYSGAVLSARAAYGAGSPVGYLEAEGNTAVFASLAYIALLWFVAAYSGFRPTKFLAVLTGAFAAVAIAGVLSPDLIVGEAAGVSSLELPWGEQVYIYTGEDAPLTPLAILAQLATLVFLVVATVRKYRRRDDAGGGFLAVGVGWFVATVVADLVVDSGAVEFIYLSDIGFLGFVVAMSTELVRDTIDAERDLLAIQSNLVELVDERTSELRQAQADLVERAAEQATTAERDRLARDLHDAVTQTLFSVNLIASSLPRLWREDPEQAERSAAELQRLTRGAMAEMRTMLRELRPQTIEETSLDSLIGQLVEGLAARHDLESDVRVETSGTLPPEVHVAVYRITQEALNNTAKHADASRLSVSVSDDSGGVKLRVEDDGRGFDSGNVGDGSMGLGIMRERASAIGATLSVTSAMGAGTSVRFAWPAPAERRVDS
jgi:signal transduction histidine kinase